MNFVQPIRSQKQIDDLGEELFNMNPKYFIMYNIAISSGLRISDVLQIKAKDIKTNYIQVMEKKTGKTRIFQLNDEVKELCLEFIETEKIKDDNFIIYSNKTDANGKNKAISRQQAYQVLKDASTKLGIENVGTHSCRKTFGYWHYKQYNDVVILQDIFNHSAPSITLRYIGITQDMKDSTIQNLGITKNLCKKFKKK